MPDITIKVVPEPATSLGMETLTDQDIISYFGLNPNDLSSEEKKQVNEIASWLTDKGETRIQKLQELKSMRYKLGSPTLGNSEITHIHKYIRLKQAVQEHEAELKTMEL